MPLFDRAPITSVKPEDARTSRFLELLSAWLESMDAGLKARRDYDGAGVALLATSAGLTSKAYQAGQYGEANRQFLELSNAVARHPSATSLIATWNDVWKVSKDAEFAAGALGRFRGEIERLGGGSKASAATEEQSLPTSLTLKLYLIIAPGEEPQVRTAERLTFDLVADVVGSPVEVLPFMQARARMFMCEEGRPKRLPPNPQATALVATALDPGDSVLGTALITGPERYGLLDGLPGDTLAEILARLPAVSATARSRDLTSADEPDGEDGELGMKMMIEAPPDLWAVFSRSEKKLEAGSRPPRFPTVHRVVGIGLDRQGKAHGFVAAGLFLGMAQAERDHDFAGYVTAKEADEAWRRGKLRVNELRRGAHYESPGLEEFL